MNFRLSLHLSRQQSTDKIFIMRPLKFLLFIASVILFWPSCREAQHYNKIRFAGEAQGTYYAITYFGNDTIVHKNEVDSLLNAFDQSVSVWVHESIISKINNNYPEVEMGRHFMEIFKQSKKIWKNTNGAFDVTVGPLVNAWGFGFKNKIPVDDRVLDSLLPLVDFEAVRIENGALVKDHPGITIDFNAIAQGYSVDLLGGFLESRGIQNYLVDIGGEVLAKGTKPGGTGGKYWVVGIEKPAENADAARTLNATVEISDRAIATSGNYRKFYEENGIRYSHTIDPRTGYPVKHQLLSATVMADSASIADGYATALMVMGPEKSKEFLKNTPYLEAYLIYSDQNGEYRTWATEKMKKLIQEK